MPERHRGVSAILIQMKKRKEREIGGVRVVVAASMSFEEDDGDET